MGTLLKISRAIDRMSAITGKLVAALTLLMVVIGGYNAVARYLDRDLHETIGFNLSSNAFIEFQWYLFSLVFLFGASVALQRDQHVRVDVLYGRLSMRKRAWIDLAGTLAFLLPFCIFTIWVSWSPVVESWRIREVSPDPGGLVRYPIKTAILVAFAMLFLQGVSEAIKRVDFLRTGKAR